LDSYHWNQGRLKKAAYLNLVDRFGIRGLSGAFYSSEHEASQGRAILPTTPAFSLPLGVDADLFNSEGTRGGTDVFEILFLGRVTAKKRLDIVLTALAEPALRDIGIHLTVAGPIDGSLPYDPRALATKLGVLDRVTFLGQVDGERRKELLRRASVFVLPSEDESFGVAVAEAMSTGCAVITTAQVGIAPEAERNGALLISSLSATSLSQSISRLKTDDTERTELGDRAREFAQKRYSWPIAAQAAIDCYEQVRRPRRPLC
jgi:glycosyltransferase involved in cell wall biosynthesis